jgi:hypothetical protein
VEAAALAYSGKRSEDVLWAHLNGIQRGASVQEREDGHLTEWDRFARAEYVRLSMEEEGDDGGGTDMLEDSLDAPF